MVQTKKPERGISGWIWNQAHLQPLDSAGERFAIVPGNQAKSLLVGRITSTDPDEVMPPPESHLSLSETEIALLKKWIEQGAEWKQHWAFIKPVKPRLTNEGPQSEALSPIDKFVDAKLTQQNLPLNPEADKRTLIRKIKPRPDWASPHH